MKGGAENRKKTILAGGLGAVALCCIIYAYNALFGGSAPATPPPTIAPVTAPAPSKNVTAQNNAAAAKGPNASVPGVAATKMASTSQSLDPTLDQNAMLRTENLVYAGSGRNIFSAIYRPPVAAALKLPLKMPPPRGPITPPPPPVYVPPPTCPPSCPPINLKFFGTAQRANGARQAFVLQGEDVYLASQGDIIARKYKIMSISPTSIQVQDLTNTSTQTLPLQQ